MAVKRNWVGTTSGNYSTAANWLPAAVPLATDLIHIPAVATQAIDAGLDQSAVALGSFIVEEGFTPAIGLVGTNLKLLTSRFEYNGKSQAAPSYLDLTTSNILAQIFATAEGVAGIRGLYLLGSNLGTLNMIDGNVGLASRFTETATVAIVRQLGGKLWLGEGVTLTEVEMVDGQLVLRCAGTTLTIHGGTVFSEEVGAFTTVTVNGGTFVPNSTGTITTLTLNGGLADFTQSGAARIVTNLKLNPGATLLYDPATLTITNWQVPTYPLQLVAS